MLYEADLTYMMAVIWSSEQSTSVTRAVPSGNIAKLRGMSY